MATQGPKQHARAGRPRRALRISGVFAAPAHALLGIAMLVALACCGAGCLSVPWNASDGSRHYLVIGVGVLSIPGSTQDPNTAAVAAVRAKTLGIAAGTFPGGHMAIGYSSYLSTVAPVDRDVIVEIEGKAGGGLSVNSTPVTQEENEP